MSCVTEASRGQARFVNPLLVISTLPIIGFRCLVHLHRGCSQCIFQACTRQDVGASALLTDICRHAAAELICLCSIARLAQILLEPHSIGLHFSDVVINQSMPEGVQLKFPILLNLICCCIDTTNAVAGALEYMRAMVCGSAGACILCCVPTWLR
jgi:hypothetical protein